MAPSNIEYLALTFFVFLSLMNAVAIRIWTMSRGFPEKMSKILAGATPLIYILLIFPFKQIGQIKVGVIFLGLLVVYIILKNFSQIQIKKMGLRTNIFILIVSLLIIYKYFFDALTHITIGFIDSYASFSLVVDILDNNTSTGYQPGYAFFIAPIYYISGPTFNLNLLGSIVGIIILIHIAYIVRAFSKRTGLIFILLLPLPFFVEVNRIIIGVTSNALSFLIIVVFLAGLIVYFQNSDTEERKYSKILLLLSLLSSACTTPVVNFYLFIPLFAILLIATQGKFSLRYSAQPLIYNFYGVILYGINAALSPLTYELYDARTSGIGTASNITDLPLLLIDGAARAAGIEESESDFVTFMKDYFLFNDEIRPISSYLDLAGYTSLLAALIIFLYFFKRKNIEFTILAFFAGYFGIITMFGIFDLSFIKGRAGWYFIFIFVLLISALLSVVITSYLTYRVFIFVLIIMNLVTLRTHPITHYRYHEEYIYFQIREIVIEKDDISQININDGLPEVGIIDQKLQVRELENILSDSVALDDTLIVLDFNEKLLDPVLSREFQFRDIVNQDITVVLEKRIEEKIKNSISVEKKIIENDFLLIYEDANYKIYFLSKE